MQPRKVVPLFNASNLDELKQFYVGKLGFGVTFDAPMYLGLRCGENLEIAFMTPCSGKEPFQGAGALLCFEVENVDAEHDRFRSLGIPIVQELKDNPWGDRAFVAVDPAGVALYVYHPIQPSAEFEAYAKE
jgi:catechol 2,3-dioxygenase-like lactoylglutathione lyase family enzyme